MNLIISYLSEDHLFNVNYKMNAKNRESMISASDGSDISLDWFLQLTHHSSHIDPPWELITHGQLFHSSLTYNIV
jgi:hypothetical protein